MRLYDWQAECLEKWEENRFRGIVNVVTGAGKTVLALAAIQRLEAHLRGQAPNAKIKVKIIVPKTFLVRQWLYALQEIPDVSRNDIGFYFGTHKSNTDCKYMIYVINSARYSITRHILEDLQSPVFIIADECHHYGTEENSKIFDFIKYIPIYCPYYTLGLSATPYSKHYESVLAPCLGKEIYRFTFAQALDADIINRFSILSICLDFTANERTEYDEFSDKLGLALLKLKKHCPHLYTRNSQAFFHAVDNIIKTHKDPEVSQLAQTVLFLSYQRKEIVYLAGSRIKCVIDLVNLIDRTAKIIIFGERIDMANEIYERLIALRPNDVGIYHSKLHKDVRKTTLRDFEDSQIKILVSCKTLDEGLNVSDADIGIMVSSTSSTRQRIQRLGRILRKKENKRHAYFYYLYIRDTMEESEVFNDLNDDMIKNFNVIDIYYDKKSGAFTNPYYEKLALIATKEASNKSWSDEKILELRRNIKMGVILCDWWLTESECMRKIKGADSKSQRNYYIAILFMIRARLSQIL